MTRLFWGVGPPFQLNEVKKLPSNVKNKPGTRRLDLNWIQEHYADRSVSKEACGMRVDG